MSSAVDTEAARERTLGLLTEEARARAFTADGGYLDVLGEADAPESTGATQDLSLIHI